MAKLKLNWLFQNFCLVINAIIESKMSRRFYSISESRELKANLHGIRFSYVFFLGFCLSLKKYALFLPHLYKFIFAVSRLLHVDKNSVQKAIFQNRTVHLFQNCFWKTFVQYVTVWLVRIWTHKNADEKHSFSWKRKNLQTRTKSGY